MMVIWSFLALIPLAICVVITVFVELFKAGMQTIQIEWELWKLRHW